MKHALAPALVLISLSCGSPGDRAVAVYSAQYSDNSLPEEIALLNDVDFEPATLVAVAYDHVVARPTDGIDLELEGNVAQWFGDQDHTEFNGLFIVRWRDLPWDDWLDSSFGFGNGLSWATDDPLLEDKFHPETGATRLLWHIAVDIGVTLPWAPDWELLLRVHHRSGVFGTFDDVDGGSNAIGFGLRYHF
ncbi:MAG: hypothetical protein AAFP86_10900 [Planctomycetota bacterium]